MIFRKHFGIKKEFILVNGDEGILEIGTSIKTICFSIIAVKNLIEFTQEVIFYFDSEPTETNKIQKVLTRGEENIFLIADEDNGNKSIKLIQEVQDIPQTNVVFENPFELIEFQDALCSVALFIIAPTLFQYTNLMRFFHELLKEEDSITKFDNWCLNDVSESSNWTYLLIKKILPNSEKKQEELSLLIFMNIQFLQSYYPLFYTIHRPI